MTSTPRPTLSLYELRREGWEAQGDYTTERRSLFADLSLDDVLREIRQKKPR